MFTINGNGASNSIASFISYSSVMMTYFGVNYFLGGIHSYASGASFTVPWGVYAAVVFFAGLAIVANMRQRKILPDQFDHED